MSIAFRAKIISGLSLHSYGAKRKNRAEGKGALDMTENTSLHIHIGKNSLLYSSNDTQNNTVTITAEIPQREHQICRKLS